MPGCSKWPGRWGSSTAQGLPGPGRAWPSLATLLALLVSLWLLSLALRHLPLGTAYAVWVGIGVLGSALLGVLLFGETLTPLRLFSLGLIIAGVVGLKMAG